MNEERRKSDRRVSPAIGDFALEERGELLARIAGLEAELEQQRGGVLLPDRAEIDRMWQEIQDTAIRSQEPPHIRFAEQIARHRQGGGHGSA